MSYVVRVRRYEEIVHSDGTRVVRSKATATTRDADYCAHGNTALEARRSLEQLLRMHPRP